MIMDKAAISGFHDAYLGLTIAQRRCLKAIIEAQNSALIEPVCQSLVDVGLVRRTGNKFVASDAGRFVVTLF
jgi:hypothetical protein